MTAIRPGHLSPAITASTTTGSASRPQPAAQSTFAQKLQGAQTQKAQQAATHVPGHSLDDGSAPLTPQELQEELRNVALQQGLMMGQRLLAMGNSGPQLDRE